MRVPETSMGGSGHVFPSTLWAEVTLAGDLANPAHRPLLERLLARYWKPAFCYIAALRRRGTDDAKDLTQEFFTRLLEKHHLQRADPERGSFRGFLKCAIKNFVRDTARREDVRHTTTGSGLIALDQLGDLPDRIEGAKDPEDLYEQEWNREVLWDALRELEGRLAKEGLQKWMEIFRAYCFPEGKATPAQESKRAWGKDEPAELSQRAVAGMFGISQTTVRKRVAYCIRELRAIAREKIREYVQDEKAIDLEFDEVMKG